MAIGWLLTIIIISFLPDVIPIHFNSSGMIDDFSSKSGIFLYPILQLIFAVLSNSKKVKYCLTHSRTFLTDIQYNWCIDIIVTFPLLVEIWHIYIILTSFT